MLKSINAKLAALLDESEALGSCLPVRDRATSEALRRRVKTGDLISPFPRLYARTKSWDTLNKKERSLHVLRGNLSLRPDSVLCGLSAALVFGFEVPEALLDDKVHVLRQRGRSTRVEGLRVHHSPRVASIQFDDFRVTPPERTVVDCARWYGLRTGLAVADSALRLGLTSKDALVAEALALPRRSPGCKAARLVTTLADGRSANGGESVARAVMYELGYRMPDLQRKLPDLLGSGKVYYADYAWDIPVGGGVTTRTILGELDGAEKYLNPDMATGGASQALLKERRRESRLTLYGAPIMRFSYAEALNLPYFDRLLRSFGVPKERAAIVSAAASPGPIHPDDEVPLEVYGLD